MKRDKLGGMTVEQLVKRFIAIALDQDKALRSGAHARFNRLFDEMETVNEELKRRSGDERQRLKDLYTHPSPQVRLKSAIATLALAPDAARQTLQIISDRDEYPQAAYARDMLSALDEGRYRAT